MRAAKVNIDKSEQSITILTNHIEDLEAFQGELLKLVMAIVMLEEVIGSKKSEEGKQGAVNSSSLLKYHTDQPFCCQVGSDWSTVSVLIGQ